jgi:hypothetical protein
MMLGLLPPPPLSGVSTASALPWLMSTRIM